MQTQKPRPKFIEAATIQERIDDVEALASRLEDDPADQLAGSRLETIYRNQGDWESVVALLLDRAEQLEESEHVEVLSEVASIYRDKLSDLDAALMVELAAFERAPGRAAIADNLDQLAYRTGRWDEVLDAYMVAAGKLAGSVVASELWLRIACAHLVTTCDSGAVSEALDRIQSLDPESVRSYLDMVEQRASTIEMIDAVAELCERIGDRARLVRALSRGVAAAGDIDTRALYHERIGRTAEKDGDAETARWHYTEALRLDPRRKSSREALVEMYRRAGDHREVARLLSSSRFSAAQTERAELAMAAASIYADELDEHTRAVNLYAFVLSHDPTHVDAALPLAERYWHSKRWQELAPLLDMLLSRYAELGPDAPARELLAYRAGRAHRELGNHDRARVALTTALEINPDHLEARLEYARVATELGDHDGACDAYNGALVIQRRRHASPPTLAETLFQMAETRRRVGDDDSALTLYESALDLAYHPGALDELRAIYERRGAWRGLVYALQCQLMRAERKDKVKLLSSIAEITGSRLDDPHGAIDAYEEAHSIDPEDRDVLCQLIEYYSAAEMWEQAVAAILKVAELEGDPIRRGKYFQAAGTIARHHLDMDRAVAYFNRALDCFFVEAGRPPEKLRASCMKAFVDLSKGLYAVREFKQLERNYRKMIRRMRAGDPELAELWHGLGQIYRKHLRSRDEAIESFEVASALDGGRLTHHRILIDLYRDAGPEQIDKAIERRHKLLAAEPRCTEHYRALRKLYLRTNRHDEAWTAARALCFLGVADPEEREDYHARKPFGGPWARGRLTEEDWALLRHPDENPRVSQIFALVCEAAALESASSARQLGIRDDPAPQFDHLRRMFMSVVGSLGLPGFQVCIQPEIQGDILLANIKRGRKLAPTFAVGRGLYQGRSVEGIVYALGRSLCYGRPSYLLRLALPGAAELESVFLAASSLSRSDVPVPPPLVGLVQRYQRALARRMPEPWRRQLATAVEQFVAEGKPYDIDGWGRAVDATCRRAGLLLSADLEAAAAAMRREPIANGEDAVAELVAHSVSPQHHQLRRKLGLTVA